MSEESTRKVFLQEAADMLQQFETLLLQAEREGLDQEGMNALFRSAHTIKGAAGLFEFDAIVRFTHTVEGILELLRSGVLGLSPELAALLLQAGDRLRLLVDRIPLHGKAVQQLGDDDLAVLDSLQAYAGHEPDVAREGAQEAGETASMPSTAPAWRIGITFGTDVIANGFDPLALFRYLGTLGTIQRLTPRLGRLPELAAMDPEACYLGFDLVFDSRAERSLIENAFEFVRDDSDIVIEALAGGAAPPHPPTDVAIPPATASNIASDIAAEIAAAAPSCPAQAAGTTQAPAKVPDLRQQDRTYMKVEANQLDELIDLVGELVIACASANVYTAQHADPGMEESMASIMKLVERIRDGSLTLRMVPVGDIFQRFPRIVRDTARGLGKEIDLRIYGADTKIDKSMVDKLGDPLMHIVRNALDHGIETADERLAAGKPRQGHITLWAYHDSGSVVIEITDDGRGIDRERVLEKACQQGLVTSSDTLSDNEILQLIFAPGFSTAAAVTDLSGRGVGMDVVKKNIESLRGEIDIESTPGRGTTMRLRLPLTLAIIDGFQVQVGRSQFVIPLDMVRECVELPGGSHIRNYLDLRGQPLSCVVLRDLFKVPGPRPGHEKVIVVQFGSRRAGLVVDYLSGELQVVIKPMGTLFRGVRGVSGSAILGSGEVALILDVPLLVRLAQRAERDAIASASNSAALGCADDLCTAMPQA